MAPQERSSPSPPPIFWFVRYGQSLSVGSVGYCGGASLPACSSGANYGNLTIFAPNHLYPPADTQFRPLSGHVYQNSPPAIESSATSMCNQYSAFSDRICATSDYGFPGASYAQLKKGANCAAPNCYFDNATGNGKAPANTGVVQARALAGAGGNPFFAPLVYFNQGESDMNSTASAAQYEANLIQLQSDFQSSVNSAIGQTGLIPIFIVQKSSWATWLPTRATPTTSSDDDGVPIGQLRACLDHYSDGTVFCICPDYPYSYGADGVHRPAGGYRAQGALEGKAMYQVTALGKGWRPFYPRNISISGNVITVQFWVPVGSLAFETTNVSPLPDGNMGFEFTDTGGSGVTLPPNSVALKPGTADSLTIALSGMPADKFELRYAWTAPNGACPSTCASQGSGFTGPKNGPRGNVADSDSRMSWAGDSLVDYAFTFRVSNISAATPYEWNPPDPDLETIPGVHQLPGRRPRAGRGRGGF